MTSLTKSCLGCGAFTDGPVLLCPRCAELVEYDRYAPQAFNPSAGLLVGTPGQELSGLLESYLRPGLFLLVITSGALLADVALCCSSSPTCMLQSLCLLI